MASVVLDDEEILRQGGMDGQGMVSLCVVKRRSLLLLKCAREGCSQVKVSLEGSHPIRGQEGEKVWRVTSTFCHLEVPRSVSLEG